MAEDVTLLPVSPFYRLLWPDGKSFDYVNDSDALEREIARFSPGDLDGYRRFHDYAEEVYREGYLKLGTVPFLKLGQMLRGRRPWRGFRRIAPSTASWRGSSPIRICGRRSPSTRFWWGAIRSPPARSTR